MENLTTLQNIFGKELQLLNKQLKEVLHTSNQKMNLMSQYFWESKGKQMRPLLVMLGATAEGEVTEATIQAAISVELLHSASLIHDDVIDNAITRRSKKTLNALWDNKNSILSGDYFVSCALAAAIKTENITIVERLCNLGRKLAIGEVLQMELAETGTFSYPLYYDIIEKKTASLFIVCIEIGILSAHQESKFTPNLLEYAHQVGMIFQIRDDIFDFFPSEKIGKSTGTDIREGKITLPLIYSLLNCPNENLKKEMNTLITEHLFVLPENADRLIQFAKETGGITFAENEITKRLEDATAAIKPLSHLPIYPHLITFAQYAAYREA